MSKILRRPMFRGGKVIDSRGTGITSGLMDTPSYATGGRVGFKFGNTYDNLYDLRQVLPYNMTGQEIMDKYNVTFPINPKSLFIAENPEPQNITVSQSGDVYYEGGEPKFNKKGEYSLGQGDTQGSIGDTNTGTFQGDFGTPQQIAKKLETNKQENSNNPDDDPLVIDEKALIREQAELFKDLLGEGKEENIKKARIQDASDYLLKFFEGSQQEGATVGSSAANVAGFAAGRPSMTDKAKAANEKTDQTAIALAINDYIAGKRSKEEINKMIAGLQLKSEFGKGTLGQHIMDAAAKAGGTITTGSIETIVRGMNPGAEVVRVTEQQVKDGYSVDASDNGKFIIEEGTKNVFEIVNGNKVRRY